MRLAVLLIDLLSLGLVAVASFQSAHLAGIAPKIPLRRAWFGMAVLLLAVLALGSYAAVTRFLSGMASGSFVVDAIVNLLGATIIFAGFLLTRLTADDVLRMAELERAAYTDKLTGLPNRRSFDSALPAQIEIARRRSEQFVLIMLDIDRFKRVNDENGHEWGDKVLAHLGRLLATHKRKRDTAYRIGGEEFAILAPQTGIGQGRAAAERLRRVVETSPLTGSRHSTTITISVGVALLHADDDGSSLANRADEALYRAKRAGRNRVCTEDELVLPEEMPADP